MPRSLLLPMLAVATAVWAQEPSPAWKSEIEAGKKAMALRNYSAAAESFRAALAHAEAAPGETAGVLEALRYSARSSRFLGRFEEAEQSLARVVAMSVEASGENSLDAASALSELAGVQRSRDRKADALASLKRAVRIRQALPDGKAEDAAKDLTAMALLQVAVGGDPKEAKEALKQALSAWENASGPDTVQLLPVLDTLGRVHRDASEYAQAEPYYQRALEIREAAFGRDASDLLATLDSLAYVYFGQGKMALTEPVYQRLLDLWIASAGPDHPMVAVTLDKMAEFYAFQQRYTEAEAASSRALALRAAIHLASLNQTGRILLMQARMPEVEDHFRRAVQIGELSKAPDELMDPVLRIYATVLRTGKHLKEAAALDKRIEDALVRKDEREGRLPSPVK